MIAGAASSNEVPGGRTAGAPMRQPPTNPNLARTSPNGTWPSGDRRPRLAPRALVAAMGLLVGVTLLIVFLGPHGRPATAPLHDAVARERLLRFTDRDDGAVVVTDGTTGQGLGVVTGQNGFLRVSLSGLARIRQIDGIGAEPPFKLTSYASGRLTLGDPVTGKLIELEAFGQTNEAVFGWFLTADSASQAR